MSHSAATVGPTFSQNIIFLHPSKDEGGKAEEKEKNELTDTRNKIILFNGPLTTLYYGENVFYSQFVSFRHRNLFSYDKGKTENVLIILENNCRLQFYFINDVSLRYNPLRGAISQSLQD